jgi:hypothetical protein
MRWAIHKDKKKASGFAPRGHLSAAPKRDLGRNVSVL